MTGLPLPKVATHAVGMPDTPRVDREAVLLEQSGQVLRGLDLLEAEFAEAEDRVHGLLGQLGQTVHVLGDTALHGGEVGLGGGGRRGLGGRRLRECGRGRRSQDEGCGSEDVGPNHKEVLHGDQRIVLGGGPRQVLFRRLPAITVVREPPTANATGVMGAFAPPWPASVRLFLTGSSSHHIEFER